MTLENSLFTILTQKINDTYSEFDIKLEADHMIYKAHFPGHPVTPGVIQLQIITELASKCLGKPFRITKIEKCKFLKVIDPVNHMQISVSIKLENDGINILATAIILDESATFTKASLIFHIQ